MSSRTEKPTPRRRARARAQGHLPHSRTFVAAWAFGGSLLALVSQAESICRKVIGFCVSVFTQPHLEARGILTEAAHLICSSTIIVGIGAMAGGLAGSILLGGGRFDLGLVRLRPPSAAQWLQQLSTGRSCKDAVAGMAVIAVLFAMGAYAGAQALPLVLRAPRLEGVAAITACLRAVQGVTVRQVGLVSAVGMIGLVAARWRYERELRMTREEVRRDHRDTEGNPELKARRRAEQRALAHMGPARGVSRASVLVVNPTHIAVALRYLPAECDAPYVVAKGRELEAAGLRRMASLTGIPIVRNVPLARSLIELDVGEEIPAELYEAAAVVLKVAGQTSKTELGAEVAS